MKKKLIMISLIVGLLLIGLGGYFGFKSQNIANLINKADQTYLIKCTYTASDSDCYRVDFKNEEDTVNLETIFKDEIIFPSFITKRSFSYPLTTYHLVVNHSNGSDLWVEVYSQDYIQVNGESYFSFNFKQLYDKLEQSFNVHEAVKI